MLVALALLACSPPTDNTELTPLDDLVLVEPEAMHPDQVLILDAGPVEPGLVGQELTPLRHFRTMTVYALPADVDPLEAVEALREQGYAAEPDLERTTLANDPFAYAQWHMEAINAEDAWEESTGNGVMVAVLDTGVSPGGEDAPHTISGWDFIQDDGWANDAHGHGTHVAGTVAQPANNGVGGYGVAPDATILAVRVLDRNGRGWTSDIIAGIELAVEEGADIINMSLGSYNHSSAERRALKDAEAAGVLMVGAAGNDNKKGMVYPARYPEVIAVTAVDARNVRAPYSNWYWTSELCAPGGDTSKDRNGDGLIDGVLQETRINGSYGHYFFQGTSMASPHVAGVAALVMALGPDATETREILQNTALDLGRSGKDNRYGYGLVDAMAAVSATFNMTDGPE